MIVTEEEAKTKRCQESYGPISTSPDGHSYAASSPFGHGYSGGGFAVQTSPTLCIASACMAWRWHGWANSQFGGWFSNEENAKSAALGEVSRIGYCGKAGKP